MRHSKVKRRSACASPKTDRCRPDQSKRNLICVQNEKENDRDGKQSFLTNHYRTKMSSVIYNVQGKYSLSIEINTSLG